MAIFKNILIKIFFLFKILFYLKHKIFIFYKNLIQKNFLQKIKSFDVNLLINIPKLENNI